MTLDYNENFRWVAARLNTYIALAWGHIISGNPNDFLKSFLAYCSYGDNCRFVTTKDEDDAETILKLLRFYSGEENEENDCWSPFGNDDWRLYAFKLLERVPGAGFGYDFNVPSTLLIDYGMCKNKFRELGVI